MRNLQTFVCKTNSYEQESTLQQVGAILKRDRSVLTGVMGTTRRLLPIQYVLVPGASLANFSHTFMFLFVIQ